MSIRNLINKMYFLTQIRRFIFILMHAMSYPRRFIRRRFLFSRILKSDSIEDRFTMIFRTNAWGASESKSGSGSSINATKSIREQLPSLLKTMGVNSVLDAPCGDFAWMRYVNFPPNIIYIGGDIVKPLIEDLQLNFSSQNKIFRHLDITKDDLPEVDLMIVRDCLFHFSYEDIVRYLKNFARSNIAYLLTTTHYSNSDYSFADIVTGDFRVLDLTKKPFEFSSNSLFTIEEPSEDLLPPRSLRLWTRNEVLEVLENLQDSKK